MDQRGADLLALLSFWKIGSKCSAWLADTLACIPDYGITKVDELLPWRWSR